ncbi:MAG: hypothetical protein ABI147_12260 [Acidobacteriaceae bacterium]
MGAEDTGAGTISTDEFLALEQKVLRAVDMIKKERDVRAAAEKELATAKAEIADLQERLAASDSTQGQLEALTRERETVRQRVEKMIAQMDELL